MNRFNYNKVAQTPSI